MGGGGNYQRETTNTREERFVDPKQQGFLQQLYQGASDAVFGKLGGMADLLAGQSQDLIEGAAGSDAGQSQIDSLQRTLNQNLTENIMPGITSRFGAAGNTGATRSVLNAQSATGRTQDALALGTSQILGQQQNIDLQAAGQLGDVFGLSGAPYSFLAQILGDPTVVGTSSSTTNKKGHGGQGSFWG